MGKKNLPVGIAGRRAEVLEERLLQRNRGARGVAGRRRPGGPASDAVKTR